MWDSDWGYGMHHWFWYWGFPFGGLWTLILIIVLINLIRGPRRYYRHWYPSSALDALEQRYARGEIGRDEYLEKKRDLLS